MGERVLVTLQPGADVGAVTEQLRGLGHTSRVAAPAPELPGVCVVTLDDEASDAQGWARRAGDIDGVMVAEPDSMKWGLG